MGPGEKFIQFATLPGRMSSESCETTMYPDARPEVGMPGFATTTWDRFDAPHSDFIKQLREDQGRCNADVAALHARLSSFEQQLIRTSERIELAAVASRIPMLIADPPKMTRLVARTSRAEATMGGTLQQTQLAPAMPVAGPAATMVAMTSQEVAELRKRLEVLEEIHSGDVGALRDAIDATRTGIARLARELHIERTERKQAVGDVQRLADDVTKRVMGPTLDRIQKSIRADTALMIDESVANMRGEISSRVQLLLAELRGEAHRGSPRPWTAPDVPATPSRAGGRTLRDWLTQEADGDVATTRSMLTQLGVFENLWVGDGSPENLLIRPNTRFVHRVIIAVKHATGFPHGILEDWPEPPEAKMDFIRNVWSNVSSVLDLKNVDFDAADVLNCRNRSRTRRLLQLVVIAATKERGEKRRNPGALPPISHSASAPQLQLPPP